MNGTKKRSTQSTICILSLIGLFIAGLMIVAGIWSDIRWIGTGFVLVVLTINTMLGSADIAKALDDK